MASDGRLSDVGIDSDALEVRRVRAEARRRLFGETSSKTRVGRFELGRPLGAGAMGTVYLATDPELDRQVALKLVHPAASSADVGRARQRLLREARAMAQINHPNVATILDVGVEGDRVYLAMEVVDGTDLAVWLDAKPPWREVVDAFVDAARGLAAAHDVGVVHRDFKPHNVLRDEAGAIKVVDFGLAAAARGFTAAVEGQGADLTEAGAALGTPAYMPPEQHEGVVDARSDQFAFCVALADALEASPAPWTVRGAVGRVLERGRRPDPERRFSDMHALADALVAAGRPRSWRRGVALAASAGLVAWWVWPSGPPDPVADADPVADVDTAEPPEAAEVRSLLEEAERLEQDGDLAAARRQAVEASRRALELAGPGLQSDAWLLRSQLAERRSDDEAALQSGTQAAWLAIDAADDRRQAQTAIHVAFLHASNAGQPDEARRWSRMARAAASRVGSPDDLAVDLDQLDGVIAMSRGDYGPAREAFVRALTVARRLHGPDDHALTPILNNLGVVAYSTADFAAAREAWLDAARIEEAALGADHPEVASALSNLAIALMAQRDYELAEQNHRRALEIRTSSLDADSPKIADSHHNLGIVLYLRGEYEEAREHLNAGLRIRTQAYGANHPSAGSSHAALGNLALRTEAWEEARRHHQRTVDAWIPSKGAEHPEVVRSMARIAEAELGLGRVEEALAGVEAALASWLPRLGPTHQDVLAARTMEGTCLLELGRDDEARTRLQAAVDAARAAEVDPTARADLEFTLIQALWRDPGRRAQAIRRAESLQAELDAAGQAEPIALRERVARWLVDPGD